MPDTGWLTGSAFEVITDGTNDWNNASNIYTSDDSHASCSIDSESLSHSIRITGFAAQIPSGAINIKLEVRVERKASFYNRLIDASIRYYNGVSLSGDDKASSSNWGMSDYVASYGDSTDDWNAGITYEQANSVDSGLQLQVYNEYKSSAATAYVDAVTIKYYYDESSSGTTYEAEGIAAGSGLALASVKQEVLSGEKGTGLLLSVKHDGVVYRYGIKDQALAAQWHGTVKEVDPVKLSLPTRHGGFLKVSAGQVRFLPSAFGGVKPWSIDVWPPPKELDAIFRCNSTGLEGSAKLFEGKLYRESVSEKGVVYDVYIPSYTETIAGGTSLASWPMTNSLIGFFEKVCDVLGLTLDSSKATADPPTLSHNLSNERLVIDLASDVAAFCCHMFWIADGILYLQEMGVSNGSSSLKNPNDFFRSPAYTDEIPVNRVVAGTHKFEGTEYPYGVDYTLSANYTGNDSQLQGIYELVNGQWAEVSVPAESGCGEFVPGKQVTLYDARLAVPSETIINMRAVSYDFIKSSVKIAGHCLMNEL